MINKKMIILLSTYNGEKYIEDQIKSILLQLSKEDELIISDDGSKDKTLEIINSINDIRIKLIHNIGKHGVVPNFENALKKATGDYIFLSDQDDIWRNDKLEKCIKNLENHILVTHNSLIVTSKGNITGKDFFSIRNSGNGYLRNLYKNSYVGSCMSFKKELLPYILPFPKNILWHDMWIGLIAELKGKTLFIPDSLLYYRRHGNNVSATSEKSNFTFYFQLKYRLQMLFYSLKRITTVN